MTLQRILAYDVGKVNIGYACTEHDNGIQTYIVHGLHVVPSKLPPGIRASDRIEFFEHQLRELAPDIVVHEDNFGLPRSIIKEVGKTIGFLELACHYEQVELKPVSPLSWMKALTGEGRADDEVIRDCIKKHLPSVVLSTATTAEHENDALGIAVAFPSIPEISASKQVQNNRAEKDMIKSFFAFDEIKADLRGGM